jgi:endonuclease I
MKITKLLVVGVLFTCANIFAQIPTGYYDGTTGLTGAALKTKLSQIITNGHSTKSYDNLYNGYPSTDTDNYYEKDGSVLDLYSENPSGKDPYVYQHGSKQCGSYKVEGDCYNREHVFPQGYFNSASPMVSDIHHIIPTDGKVNGMRSNYPFGKVGSATFTSENGSKLGTSISPNYTGKVFEPIDEFKGDIARMLLYFATRYESKLSSFGDNDILASSSYPGIDDWELAVLKEWHTNDPVSQREIDRNNAAYTYQGNRNPFIDHPEYVALVWGTTTPDTEAPSTPTNLTVTASTSSSISLTWTASTDNTIVAGYDIYVDGVLKTTSTSNNVIVTGLNASTTYSFYIKAKDASGNVSGNSNTVTGTTTENTGGGGNGGTTTSCGTEDFEGVSGAVNSYKTVTWTNAGITWTATDSRSDQTINNKAITVRNGALSSSTISGGIGSLTITSKVMFSGNNGSFKLFINGVEKGTIPYTSSATTTTISNINVSGNVIISIQSNSITDNRIGFDDLSWTCYNDLATAETNTDTFSIYPNPVKNNMLFVKSKNLNKINKVEIYNTNGILVQVAEKPFFNKNYLILKNLPKGVYLAKFDHHTQKFIIE